MSGVDQREAKNRVSGDAGPLPGMPRGLVRSRNMWWAVALSAVVAVAGTVAGLSLAGSTRHVVGTLGATVLVLCVATGVLGGPIAGTVASLVAAITYLGVFATAHSIDSIVALSLPPILWMGTGIVAGVLRDELEKAWSRSGERHRRMDEVAAEEVLSQAVDEAAAQGRRALSGSRDAARFCTSGGPTLLPNRFIFERRLDQAILAARQDGGKVGVLLLECDDATWINERFGRDGVDAMLMTLTTRLEHALGEGGLFASLGDHKFAVVLEPLEEGIQAMVMADDLLAATGKPIEIEGHRIRLTARIGVAVADGKVASRRGLMKAVHLSTSHAETQEEPGGERSLMRSRQA